MNRIERWLRLRLASLLWSPRCDLCNAKLRDVKYEVYDLMGMVAGEGQRGYCPICKIRRFVKNENKLYRILGDAY